MRTGKSIIGLRVISQADGVNLGSVRDLIFDHETNRLLGLLLSEKDLFGLIGAQVVPWDEVASVGPDAVVAKSAASRVKAHDAPQIKRVLDSDTGFSGTRIFSSEGRDLGTFADLMLDESTGQVLGYEISGGFVADTMNGKRFLPALQELNLGPDVAVVPPSVAAQLEAQVGKPNGTNGAASAYDAARAKISEAYHRILEAGADAQKSFVVGRITTRDVFLPAGRQGVVDSVVNSDAPNPSSSISYSEPSMPQLLARDGEVITREQAELAGDSGILQELVLAVQVPPPAQPDGGALNGNRGETMQERALVSCIGRPAGQDVIEPDGTVLVAHGEVITIAAVDRARRVGRSGDLIASAGLGAAARGADHVRETASTLWDALKTKAAELTGVAQEKKAEMDERALQTKIKNALGRPVTRVILDLDDTIILNPGDLITHAAIERARAADALDILLDSVYVADPQRIINESQGHELAAAPDTGTSEVAWAEHSAAAPENSANQGQAPENHSTDNAEQGAAHPQAELAETHV